uniref:Deoxynucleotidyltransferase terminal-interacting protein 1 n=1 Tax=Xiphophorus couchianus TaxID=32473 RepID=A0A3B5MH08_9TELE
SSFSVNSPWNLMIKHRHVQRRGRRSHTAVSYTDPQVSMDLLRAVLQPSFNDDIMAVFRKYQKFFEKAAENVKENVGEDVQRDQLIREACRNVLEHVRSLPVSSHSSLVYLHSPGSVISLPGQTAVSRGGGQKNGVRSHDEGTCPLTDQSEQAVTQLGSDLVLFVLQRSRAVDEDFVIRGNLLPKKVAC